jgi:hypothetical protein
MKEMERIVEEKSSKVEENLKFLAGNLDDLSLEELKSLELEIREIHQNIQKTKVTIYHSIFCFSTSNCKSCSQKMKIL